MGETSISGAFAHELARPRRLAIWVGSIALATVGLAVLLNPAAATAGAALLLLGFLALTAITATANRDAAHFTAYAVDRGLERIDGPVGLPFYSNLLRLGERSWSEETLVGEFDDGTDAVIALWVYEGEEDGDATRRSRQTLVGAKIPTLRNRIGKLTVQPRQGFRFFDSAEDALRSGRHRVELESAELDRRYEVFAGSESDEAMARRILSPSFIVALTERTEPIAFEFERGELICAVPGRVLEPDQLDSLWAGAEAVAKRLRAEGEETGEGGDPGGGLGIFKPARGIDRADTLRTYVVCTMAVVGLIGGVVLWAVDAGA